MSLRLNGSTSGYVELDAPATAGSNTLTLPDGNGSSGQYLQTNGSGVLSWQTVATPTIAFESYAIIADQKAAGTNGGTFTSGSWVTRELNTELTDPDNIVSIATNQFTLAAGSYLIKASAPVYQVNFHQVRLYNVTDTATAIVGYQAYGGASAAVQTRSELSGRITITDTKTFELQHRCSATRTTNGLGNGVDLGEVNLFAMVEIYKEAA